MPVLRGVYDRVNVIIDGEVRGLTLAPQHYVMLSALSAMNDPISPDALLIDGPTGLWMDLDKAIASGAATLGEPFSEVRSIGTVGDSRFYGRDGLRFRRET